MTWAPPMGTISKVVTPSQAAPPVLYRLMDGQAGRPGNGPAAATAYAGNFIAQNVFSVTAGGLWLNGYYFWCAASGQLTAPVKCGLWVGANTGNGTTPAGATLVAGSTVTSGPLTPGAWNYVPLAQAVALALGMSYVACVGWAGGAGGGFPDTPHQFGAANPYAAGIVNGPVVMYSDTGGTNPNPWGWAQMLAQVGPANYDPAITGPGGSYGNSDNGWVDIQISNTAPGGYAGAYQLWPNAGAYADEWSVGDAPANYTLATEVHLARAATGNAIFFYSPKGTTQLPTVAGLTTIGTGGVNSGVVLVANSSPAWSGPAGSGWISTPINVAVPAGAYRVWVYNGAATPVSWSVKRLGYWGSSSATAGYPVAAGSGITSGPLFAPAPGAASACYSYGVPTPGANGSTVTEGGQSSFWQGPPNSYPNQYVGLNSPGGDLFQNYWVDLEVT